MSKKGMIAVLLFLIICAVVCVGCDTVQETRTLELVSVSAGADTRLISITSDEHYIDRKEAEVGAGFAETVNGGDYNINTATTSYTNGRLTAAEITYDSSGRGEGNRLRVLLIQSDEHHYYNREVEVKPKVEEVVNSGTYDIEKVHDVYASGYLVAAEIYYWVEE